MSKREKAFTLIEVLVVISILGVLMGLVSMLVMKAGSHQNEQDAEQLVNAYLPTIIERYQAEFSKWPPMSIKELNGVKAWKDVGLDNTTNECIECLVAALRHPDFSARLEEGRLPGKNPFGNTDEDIFSQVPAGSTGVDAMEILDPWGNPIVYIHKNNYGQTVQIENAAGDVVDVEAVRRGDGGTYYEQSRFQIISVGENGVQDEPGLGSDDIMNFTVDEDE